MIPDNRAQIVDQFTKQANPFAESAAIRDAAALERIVYEAARATPADVSLDVACGPGLLACAFARAVRHAVGVDLTAAMLQRARCEQAEAGLSNLSWHLADVNRLPYADATFTIVTCRFAFHHVTEPRRVLLEMIRVCRPGGRIVVIDSAPAADKSDAFNRMEVLRDPSHVRAMTVDEHTALIRSSGLPNPRVIVERMRGELEGLLARSFPAQGDADRIRAMFRAALADDFIDMEPAVRDGRIVYAFPVAIFSVER